MTSLRAYFGATDASTPVFDFICEDFICGLCLCMMLTGRQWYAHPWTKQSRRNIASRVSPRWETMPAGHASLSIPHFCVHVPAKCAVLSCTRPRRPASSSPAGYHDRATAECRHSESHRPAARSVYPDDATQTGSLFGQSRFHVHSAGQLDVPGNHASLFAGVRRHGISRDAALHAHQCRSYAR
jgi:hypothetical protein